MSYTRQSTSGTSVGSGLIFGGAGAALASASTITPTDFFHEVTGSTTINTISTSGFPSGRVPFLVLKAAASATWALGSTNILAPSTAVTAGTVITLVLDGSTWREVSRVQSGNEMAITRVGGDQALSADLDLGTRFVHSRSASTHLNLRSFAATKAQRDIVGNNAEKPISAYYGTLAAAQADYPAAAALTDQLDWCVLKKAIAEADDVVNGIDGTIIDIPKGVYFLNTGLDIPNKVRLRGVGGRSSVIRPIAGYSGTAYLFRWINGTSSAFDTGLEDLWVRVSDGANTHISAVTRVCEVHNWNEDSGLRRVIISDSGQYGVYVLNNYSGSAMMQLQDVEIFQASSSTSAGAAVKVELASATGFTNVMLDRVTLVGNATTAAAGHFGVDADDGIVTMSGCHVEYVQSAVYLRERARLLALGLTGSPNDVTNVLETAADWTGRAVLLGVENGGATNRITHHASSTGRIIDEIELDNRPVQSGVSANPGTVNPNLNNGHFIVYNYTTSGGAMTVSTPSGTFRNGSELVLGIRNGSGGAITVTFSSDFKTAGYTDPANGTLKTARFVYVSGGFSSGLDAKWLQIGGWSADI